MNRLSLPKVRSYESASIALPGNRKAFIVGVMCFVCGVSVGVLGAIWLAPAKPPVERVVEKRVFVQAWPGIERVREKIHTGMSVTEFFKLFGQPHISHDLNSSSDVGVFVKEFGSVGTHILRYYPFEDKAGELAYHVSILTSLYDFDTRKIRPRIITWIFRDE